MIFIAAWIVAYLLVGCFLCAVIFVTSPLTMQGLLPFVLCLFLWPLLLVIVVFVEVLKRIVSESKP